MNHPERVVSNSWLAMVALQAIGSIDSTHKLPTPKRFVAITILWAILSLVAEMGYAKHAARFAVLLLITGTFIGPFGKRLADFLNNVSDTFAIPAVKDPTDTVSPPGFPRNPGERPG